MRIRIANLKTGNKEAIGYAHSDCQAKKISPRKQLDMHMLIANLKKLTQEAIGHAHSDCQSKKT